MEIADIRAVNDLFVELYPYIGGQVRGYFDCRPGLGLELGPFAPGIAIDLARACPELRFIVGTEREDVNDYAREAIGRAGMEARFEVRSIDPFDLPFPEGSFDLVVFRGALFFWEDEPALLQGIDRVLRPGGVAFVGGGFGADAPDRAIDAIVERSRELNRRLGKRNIPIGRARAIVEQAGLAGRTTVDRRRGLWLIVRKPSNAQPY